ncbi:hypothetical protein [Thauera sp.]|uniref:hypothetical protein n=1 Tax=Thauera sp. TaxID=1905334 RepID=UPI002C2A390D|nr:hypothetical protein [Thauera sp.]HRP25971.1 hypothetical protein [Thauera sp.]
MKREIETVRNVIVVAIVAALLAFVIWTVAAVEMHTSPEASRSCPVYLPFTAGESYP